MAIRQPPIQLGPPAKLELRECGLEQGSPIPFVSGDLYPARSAGLIGAAVRRKPVFDAIHGLEPGEAVRLNLDHDPAPLLEIVETKHPGRYAWEPLLEGPPRWIGLIRRAARGTAAARLRGGVRRLAPVLDGRAGRVGARARLEGELQAVAVDLLGPFEPDELSAESAAWLTTATAAAVSAVGEASLSVLTRALDTLLRVAPPAVVHELDEARERHEAGVV